MFLWSVSACLHQASPPTELTRTRGLLAESLKDQNAGGQDANLKCYVLTSGWLRVGLNLLGGKVSLADGITPVRLADWFRA